MCANMPVVVNYVCDIEIIVVILQITLKTHHM